MKDIKELSDWDWPDTRYVQDGYDMTSEPDLTQKNFQILVDKVNELTEAINEITNSKGGQ